MEKYDVVKFVDNDFELNVRIDKENETVWLTQEELSLLFDVNVPAVNKHILNIIKYGELDDSTISILEKVQLEGELDKSTSVHFLHRFKKRETEK